MCLKLVLQIFVSIIYVRVSMNNFGSTVYENVENTYARSQPNRLQPWSAPQQSWCYRNNCRLSSRGKVEISSFTKELKSSRKTSVNQQSRHWRSSSFWEWSDATCLKPETISGGHRKNNVSENTNKNYPRVRNLLMLIETIGNKSVYESINKR